MSSDRRPAGSQTTTPVVSVTEHNTVNNNNNAAVDAGSLGKLFAACDLDGSGFIDREELSAICNELSGEELMDVFRQLDSDGDGKISLDEFAEGFQAMRDAMAGGGSAAGIKDVSGSSPGGGAGRQDRARRVSMCLDWRRNSREWSSTDRELFDVNVTRGAAGNGGTNERRKSLFDLIGCLDEGFTALSCQELICEMYQQLHDNGLVEQLAKFEDIVVAVIKDVRKHQCENERLERSYHREKEQHAKHLHHLEEDMEAQMQRVEQRVRKEEREKYEALVDEMRTQHTTELDELQTNLNRLQTLDVVVPVERPNDDMKTRVDELYQETRSMRRSLNEAQTSLALARCEVATIKVQYEEKCYELETEKQALVEYMKEHDNLTRQIHMLHDANKQLHDANDDLREALETARSVHKRPHSLTGRNQMLRSLSTGSRGEYVRRYLQESTSSPTDQCLERQQQLDERPEVTSLAEELSLVDVAEGDRQTRGLLPTQDSCEIDSSPEDIDSGHFTMKDTHCYYSDDESTVGAKRRSKAASARRQMYRSNSAVGSQMVESFDTTSCSSCHGTGAAGGGGLGYLYETGGAGRGGADVDGMTVDDVDGCSSILAPSKPITHEAERIFKIVLAGDAAVGKSSFIMRLCKNKFVSNLNSTLGVDFQTKTLEVGGRVIALQLWDTAGQERFRSIAKSYFRRADGVLLLYDVTYERSFLNVRDWLEAIEEGAQKQLPIMLIGNKCDLRTEQTADSGRTCVKMEEGQRLAREFQGLFIESSAKDGRNVLEAVTELSRMLITNEDLEVQSIGLKLQDATTDGPNKKKSPCCNL